MKGNAYKIIFFTCKQFELDKAKVEFIRLMPHSFLRRRLNFKVEYSVSVYLSRNN